MPDWRVFYVVAIHSLAQAGVPSLVTTYRNKYTLHRSLAAAATFGVWASTGLVVARAVRCEVGLLLPLVALGLAFTLLVFVFSSSYTYYWRLLGDTVVAEAFALTAREVKS